MNGSINKTQTQEILHYFLFDPNIYISAVMTLKKKNDVRIDEVVKAVEKAYTQNETTMSKVVLDNGEAYFENMSETGCKVFVDQRDWKEILDENEKNTFRINEGELARTFIIDKKEDVIVFVMAHHILGDGYSLVTLSQDILSNLAGEQVEYKPLYNNVDELIYSSVKYPFMKKIGIKLLNGQWKKTGKAFTWEDYYDIHQKFWKNRKRHISTTTIAEDELLRMKAESKNMGITLNSYMIAKHLKNNSEHEIIGIPVSYRKDNRSLSNKVSVIKIKYQYNAEKSFEENAKEIHAIIKDNLEDPSKKFFISKSFNLFTPTLVDAALMAKHAGYKNETAEKMIEVLSLSGENKTQLGVTNLTNIEQKAEYDSFKVQDFKFIAAPMSTTSNVISLCTLENKMSICYTSVKKTNNY